MPPPKPTHFQSQAWHALSLFPNLEEGKPGWTCVTLPSSAASVTQAAASPLRPDLSHPRARPLSQQGPVITILRATSRAVFPYLWKSWQGSSLRGVERIGGRSCPQSLGRLEHCRSHHLKRWTHPHIFSPVLQFFNSSRKKVSYLLNTMTTSCLLLGLRTDVVTGALLPGRGTLLFGPQGRWSHRPIMRMLVRFHSNGHHS